MTSATRGLSIIIEEILRDLVLFAEKGSSDIRAVMTDLDPWYSLPHPSGQGSLLTSKHASELVDELTARAINLRNLTGRVSTSNLKTEIGSELVKRFITEGREVDARQSDRLLSWAAKRAERRCGKFTYIFPIRFTFTDEPRVIELGPVKLVWIRQPQNKLRHLIKSYMQKCSTSDDKEWARAQLRKALKFYGAYKWIGLVEVSAFEIDRAEAAARELLVSALDCLHFVIGRRATYRLDIGQHQIANDIAAMAWVDADDELHVRTSVGSLDSMGFRDGWSSDLSRADVIESLEFIQIALEAKANPLITRPLAHRFLDAARWFGEAVRDQQPFSKILKYTTAIERLVVAGTTENIAETVAERVADITLQSDDVESWNDKKSAVKKIYRVRSRLVHGSVSPFAGEVVSSLSECGDIAEEVLYSILLRYTKEGLLTESLTARSYAAWFHKVRQWVSNLHQQQEVGS